MLVSACVVVLNSTIHISIHRPALIAAYTNGGVTQTLTFAASAAATLGVNASAAASWLDAAARIVVPFDETRQYHPEYQNYVVGTKVKQADTILLGFPLAFSHPTFTPATLANDLAAYGNCTDSGGPAMTWGMFAVGYIQLGPAYASLAASNFNRSFANAQEPFYVWTETPTGGTPNFLTGAGGFLQTAFSGYTGLRVNASGCFFLAPALPEQTRTVGIRGVSFLGVRFSVSYDDTSITFSADAQGAERIVRSPVVSYSNPCDFSFGINATACRLRIASHQTDGSLASVAVRAQWGRVRLSDGHVVAARSLQVVDAAGRRYALVPGEGAVTIPLQTCSVQAAN